MDYDKSTGETLKRAEYENNNEKFKLEITDHDEFGRVSGMKYSMDCMDAQTYKYAYKSNYDDSIKTVTFGYRGYYLDNETGMCYPNSRYYDPTVGRFVSPDSLEYLEPENLGGQNFWLGFAAGAIGGAVEAFVGVLIGLIPGAKAFAIVLGRGASTAIYGILNELFQSGLIDGAIDVFQTFAYFGGSQDQEKKQSLNRRKRSVQRIY